MKINLKPCPFCGSKAILDTIDKGINSYWYAVICSRSACRCGVFSTDYSYYTAEDAIAAWNRRYSGCR